MTLSIPFANKSVLVPGVGGKSWDFCVSDKAYRPVRSTEDMLPLEEYTPLSKGDALNPDLTEELQYSSTYGTPHFLKWLKEHVQRVHAPKYDDWNILCTAGNTDGTDAVMRACLDRGDHLLVEEFGKYSR
jgi:aromatic amino acid aminotransferase I